MEVIVPIEEAEGYAISESKKIYAPFNRKDLVKSISENEVALYTKGVWKNFKIDYLWNKAFN